MVKICEVLPEVVAKCDTHGEYMAKRVSIAGKIHTLGCQKCAAEHEASSRVTDGQVMKMLLDADIPPRYRSAVLDRVNPGSGAADVAKRLSIFAEYVVNGRHRGRFVVMTGETGTGKTWLACATIRAIAGRVSALYRTEHGIVQAARDCWGVPGAKESQAIEREKKCGLLVIDEVGAGRDGDQVRQRVMFDLIDYRYSHLKPTMICTNLDDTAMIQWLGRRAADRIAQCSVYIPVSGKSLRA